jgi:hypothetical protein
MLSSSARPSSLPTLALATSNYIPAESVYAAFEVKQQLDKPDGKSPGVG